MVKRLPSWLKVPLPGLQQYRGVRGLLEEKGLHTVCQAARCPNIGECFGHGTATFLIMGDICTRNCRFCHVQTGKPRALDANEPVRLGEAVAALGLQYVVITSVTRDDLPDGGAGHFASIISELRRRFSSAILIEVLVPDFQGSETALRIVLDAGPDVLNHNIETISRLYHEVRPHAMYNRSLELLARASQIAPTIQTKSGLMVGLGETLDEIITCLTDLHRAGCQSVTIGQYLAPSKDHLAVVRYYHPKEFTQLEEIGRQIGFRAVYAGPLVRSSYRAHQMFHVPSLL